MTDEISIWSVKEFEMNKSLNILVDKFMEEVLDKSSENLSPYGYKMLTVKLANESYKLGKSKKT